MQRLHIFRAGTHTPMQGEAIAFSAADLAASAAAYDPARHEAPIVVGHPRLNAPAYGWVAGLQAEPTGLFATAAQVDADFAELVKGGRYKKISASFFAPKAAQNPVPGIWYLRHVGFLGAVPPAVKGLREVEFGEGADGIVEFAWPGSMMGLGWLLSDMAALFRGIRDVFVADKGAAEADRLVPGSTLQRISEEAARIQAAAMEPIPVSDAPAQPGFADPQPRKEPAVADTPNTPPADLAAREAQIAERERQLAARETELRAAAAAEFAEGLVREARLPKGQAARVAALLVAVETGEPAEISFAEGDKPVKEAPGAALRALLKALPATVSFADVGGKAGPGQEAPPALADFAGMRLDPDRAELHVKAVAYQRAHPNTDYLAAVAAVENAG